MTLFYPRSAGSDAFQQAVFQKIAEKVGEGHQLGWILWESKLKETEVQGEFAIELGRKMRVKSKR